MVIKLKKNTFRLDVYQVQSRQLFVLLYESEASNFLLGIELRRYESGMHLTQVKYIKDLLKRFNFEHLKPCATPMKVGKYISKNKGEKMVYSFLYRSAIGGLQYLGHTRPDISFAVNKLSVNFYKLFQRLIGMSDIMDITGFADADWASCLDDRSSTVGYCVYLGDTLVAWSSKKQQVVGRSSAESEYRALAQAFAEITWVESLLKEIKL
ncbi:uncharacterized protein LOC111397981 [Olea europaea var. sylvestris]|uniref:uncharacterized protein LOC111397981 n=1 Tax=Olea europaea var. sylvestris TaxID=158386 RepID=UPI000C1D2589|nr:uncharacterized protein LOC111397981 [Olea europaea var. sylvestris]